jgi:hypothetical protein
MTSIPSPCRIATIAINDAMILPYDANLARMEFSEGTGDEVAAVIAMRATKRGLWPRFY